MKLQACNGSSSNPNEERNLLLAQKGRQVKSKQFRTSKNVASSRNLRVSQFQPEIHLRNKITALQEQVDLLQKNNLNMLLPITEKKAVILPDYEGVIVRLRVRVVGLEQEGVVLRVGLRRAEVEREGMRVQCEKQVAGLRENIERIKEEKERMAQKMNYLSEELERCKTEKRELEKQGIELRVENKFIREDISELKEKLGVMGGNFDELKKCVLAVGFNSRIYTSRSVKVTAVETEELVKLKDRIAELEQRIRRMSEVDKPGQIFGLGARKEHMGEQIVRLKKNIDMQLGLKVDDGVGKQFLTVYNDTNSLCDALISGCKK